jgi:hypothetical protein
MHEVYAIPNLQSYLESETKLESVLHKNVKVDCIKYNTENNTFKCVVTSDKNTEMTKKPRIYINTNEKTHEKISNGDETMINNTNEEKQKTLKMRPAGDGSMIKQNN